MPSVLQHWVMNLSMMQQSVLITAIRGPDGIHKDHIAKSMQRWLRRCVLLCSFEKTIHDLPYQHCGGNFTGVIKHPVEVEHTRLMHMLQQPMRLGSGTDVVSVSESILDAVLKKYVKSLDELPHHYQMHIVHAAEIIGYKHPTDWTRRWWYKAYVTLVEDLHLHPETLEEMDKRLGDNEDNWRAREATRKL